MKQNILDLMPEELENILVSKAEKSFRAKQICNWIFDKLTFDFDQMNNLSKELRSKLKTEFELYLPEILEKQSSSDGTTKYLLKLIDNANIEMVLIPHEDKNTLCISSQVGCARQCAFCATAKLGLKRNLDTNEIVGQVLLAIKQLHADRKLTNIVFMGMGEPLDNLDNVMKAVKILQHEKNLQFSPRRITISTCGIVPKIDKLRELLENNVTGSKIKLAVSLNSAIDDKRDILMPINKVYSLAKLKKSLLSYRKASTFRITFEYIMIANFNMSKEDVKYLKKFAGDISCKINLIPWNKVEGLGYESPTNEEIDNFINELKSLSAAITVRHSKGADIAAACGQLAAKQQ